MNKTIFLHLFKRNVIYALLIIGCFLTSCSSKNLSSCKNKSVLRINLCDDPLSWDPRSVRLVKDVTLISHLFEGLTRRDEVGNIENGIAEEICISEDKKTYKIYLKKAFWSNGEVITAYDFKASWLQVLQSNFSSFYSHFMDIIKNGRNIRLQKMEEGNFGVKVLSNRVLLVELERPYPYFKELLSLPVFFPVHESLRNSVQEDKIVFPLISNGAFRLVHWQPRFNIKLEKNPYYWETSKVNLKYIDMSIIADSATEVLLFEKKNLDWLGQPWSSSILSEAREKLTNQIKSYNVLGTFGLLVNVETFPLNNVKLRKALSLALNKESIIKYLLKGNQFIASTFLPKPLSYLSEDFLDTQFNIVIARKLFEEALKELGLTKDDLSQITLIYPSSNPRCSAIAQEIQQQWKKHLNFLINLKGFEYRYFLEKRNQGAYHISTANWNAEYTDPLALLQILSDDTFIQRYTKWKNEEFLKLIDDAKKEVDDKKRHKLIKQAEKILYEELPILPLYHSSFDYALSEDIKGAIFYSSGVVNLNYITFRKL